MSNKIIFLGATGAVGTQALHTLLEEQSKPKITLLGRRAIEGLDNNRVRQHTINIFEPETYKPLASEHDIAICTLGVGEPSKISKEEFIKIDKDAVIDFAKECKRSGVKDFHLLASVGISSNSVNYFISELKPN